jgi:hypothetical protein
MRRICGVIVGIALVIACTARAEPPREAHGLADAYAASGVAIAWAILRGSDENATLVVARVVADPHVYPWVSAVGIDPFTQRKQPLMPAMQTNGKTELRASRASFADFPRTEFQFYASDADAKAGAPSLVVYYLGIPDTTPELTNAAALEGSLADRIVRAQKSTP